MGPKQSSEGNGNGNEVNKSKTDLSGGFFIKDNYSSYKGVISSMGNANDKEKSLKRSNSSSDTFDPPTSISSFPINFKDPNLVNTTFVWKEGGNVAYVTGSFANWNQRFLMIKQGNEHILTLELEKGVHQYKFIVDNTWRYSGLFPTVNDGKGNINNIIDNTPPVVMQEEVKEKEKDKEKQIKPKKKKSSSKHNPHIKLDDIQDEKKINFSCMLPSRSVLNTEAPFLPTHYRQPYNINTQSRQKNIGSKRFMHNPSDDQILNENTSFKNIATPPHIHLNHYSTYMKKFNGKILVSSTHQRINHKYLSLIYFKNISET